jgi:iron only hydrogenase large subunit-like protein
LQAFKNGKANVPIISQPCPAVVSYIEIYKPQLAKYLAPTGSPTMDMACWVHDKHPGYKLAFISPCIAKKREFEDPNTKNQVHYNVTIANLKKYLAANNIDIQNFQADFDGPAEAERALLFSQPGGLFETFKRYQVSLKPHQVRRTEGLEIYEEFFEELEKELENDTCDLKLVDILNCLHGCNRGTGVNYKEFTTDEILKRQNDRLEEHLKNYYPDEKHLEKLDQLLQKMENIDFSREYTERSETFKELLDPTPEQVAVLNNEMGKHIKKDLRDCGACGYHSCINMAKAVLNGLYRPEQCHHYLENFYLENHPDAE